jgi:hypothetical protein
MLGSRTVSQRHSGLARTSGETSLFAFGIEAGLNFPDPHAAGATPMMPRVLPLALTLPFAFVAASCSDPPPTPAAVGLSLSLKAPDATKVAVGSRSCHAGTSGGFTYVIGAPNPDRTIEDGTNGVGIECVVRENGSFTATGHGTDTNGKKPISFSFSGSIKDKANAAVNLGGMSFFSPDTLAMVSSGFADCTFGPVLTLKKGAILTDVDCPMIASSDDTTSGCSVEGTIAFEYCKTGEEED